MKHHEKSHHNLNVYQSKQIFGAHSYEINKKVMVNFCLKMTQNHNFSQLIFMEVFLPRPTSHPNVWKSSIIGIFVQSN